MIKLTNRAIFLSEVLNMKLGTYKQSFIDMPVVNVGTAKNLFGALKLSLTNKGLDFSNLCGIHVRYYQLYEGVQVRSKKLIRNECPNIYDVGCICHLADLTIKAGLQTFPVDIDQLFVDIFLLLS